MKCFNHQEAEAVAICKNCGKGLCHDCAVDLTDGVACKNRCEDKVKEIIQLIDKNKTTHQKTAAVYKRGAIINGLCGLIFFLFGVVSSFVMKDKGFSFFMLSIGLVLIIAGFINYSAGKKINSP